MTEIRPARAEELLLAMERQQTLAEIRFAAARLPAQAATAMNPLRWLRRYPVATSIVAALGVTAVVGRLFAMRRRNEAVAKPAKKYWGWVSSLSQEMLAIVRRGLLTAASARLMMGSAPPAGGAQPGIDAAAS